MIDKENSDFSIKMNFALKKLGNKIKFIFYKPQKDRLEIFLNGNQLDIKNQYLFFDRFCKNKEYKDSCIRIEFEEILTNSDINKNLDYFWVEIRYIHLKENAYLDYEILIDEELTHIDLNKSLACKIIDKDINIQIE